MRLPVLHDPANPAHSGWRDALTQTSLEYFVVVGISLLVSAWLGLFIYRYLLWRKQCA
jgi:hypothetical protein